MSFWVGLALAIPLAIVANLLTPATRARLDSMSEQRSSQRQLSNARRQQFEAELRADGSRRVEYLVLAGLKISFAGAVGALVSGALALGANAGNSFYVWGDEVIDVTQTLYAASTFVGLIATLVILTIVRDALGVARRTGSFDADASQS